MTDDTLAEDCLEYARNARRPIDGRLVGEIAALLKCDAELDDRIARAFKGRTFTRGVARPLLLKAAIHADYLRDPAHPLRDAIRSQDPDAVRAGEVRAALAEDRAGLWRDLARRSVQTNETVRAVTWWLPLSIWTEVAQSPSPVVLVDLGCSAGMNLIGDRLDCVWTDETGGPIPLRPVPISARYGLDREPLDITSEDDVNWLRACLWLGDREREARLEASLRIAAQARKSGEVIIDSLDAADMPARVGEISARHPDALVVAYHTAFLPYLDDAATAQFRARMQQWIDARGDRAMWLEQELVATERGHSEITVHLAGTLPLVIATSGWNSPRLNLNLAALEALRTAARTAALKSRS